MNDKQEAAEPALATAEHGINFIQKEIKNDLESKRYSRPVCTRFPPEPNGYWHIGHVLALTINQTTAETFDGLLNIRFDDTNPTREKQLFVDEGLKDFEWLGIPLTGKVVFASDFFQELYDLAEQLVKQGDAYVCDLSPEEANEMRGDFHKKGVDSPYRTRSIEENLTLLRSMKDGQHAPGDKTLRAKIDMSSPNVILRDPILVRILDAEHYRQGGKWKVYPSYDFAQPFNDAFDGVTHSLCSGEFVSHRPLYDWLLEKTGIEEPPRQIEFGKMRIEGAILGKRHIRELVEDGTLDGWDDPRLYTLRGLRRRGFEADSIRKFCRRLGIQKQATSVDIGLLDNAVREDLNQTAGRRMAVMKPVKLVLENIAEGEEIETRLANNPTSEAEDYRTLKITREVYIDADDFMIDPPRKYFRLSPDKEVRLRGAYVIKCTRYDTDADGNVTTIYAECDRDTLGKKPADGRKVKGVIHWVSAAYAVDVEVRLYDRLIAPDGSINKDSMTSTYAKGEASLKELPIGEPVQFERVGYFCADKNSQAEKLIFNQTVTLRDSYNQSK